VRQWIYMILANEVERSLCIFEVEMVVIIPVVLLRRLQSKVCMEGMWKVLFVIRPNAFFL